MSDAQQAPLKLKKTLVVGVLITAVIILIWVMSVYLTPGIDWIETFYPAAQATLKTGSPYALPKFVNAPWAILPIIPFALLPINVGRAAYFLASLAGYAYSAYKLGARRWAFVAFMVSPPVLHCLLNGNNDWLALLGFVLPPQVGIFFISVKPQMGIAVGIFWLVEAWRNGGFREVLRVFGPFAMVLAITFLVYGLWPLRFVSSLTYGRNTSLWPLSIPVGFGLLVSSLRRRDLRFAMGASPCLSPYLILHSWVGALAAIIRSEPETVAAVIGLWVLVVMIALRVF